MNTGLTLMKQVNKSNDYSPCISIFLPTRRKLDKNFKTRDRVKFMRIITGLEKQLSVRLSDPKLVSKILMPAKVLLEDQKFWINQQESLVVFLAEDFCEYYRLPVPTEQAVCIDTEFNVKLLASLMANNEQPFLSQHQKIA